LDSGARIHEAADLPTSTSVSRGLVNFCEECSSHACERSESIDERRLRLRIIITLIVPRSLRLRDEEWRKSRLSRSSFTCMFRYL